MQFIVDDGALDHVVLRDLARVLAEGGARIKARDGVLHIERHPLTAVSPADFLPGTADYTEFEDDIRD